MVRNCFLIVVCVAFGTSLSLVAATITLNNLTDNRLVISWIQRDPHEVMLGPGSGYYPAGGIRHTESVEPQRQKNITWIDAKDDIFTLDHYVGSVAVVDGGSYTIAPSAEPDDGQTLYVLAPNGVVTLAKMAEREWRMTQFIG